MNVLIVGDPDPALDYCTGSFLLLDDGPLIDAFKARTKRKYTELDFHKHSFNPLRHNRDKLKDYKRRREIVETFDATFERGDGTLTKDTGLSFIRRNLKCARSFEHLIPTPDAKSTTGHIWAYDKVSEILESPILSQVLCNPTNFSPRGIILARLDRSEMPDFDCQLLGRLLMSIYKGQIIVPHFAFYGHKGHIALIRQNRLIAGVRYLDETALKDTLLLINNQIGQHCLHKDAETLADHAHLERGTEGFKTFLHFATK